jgi:hypothetical protein
MNKHEPNVHDTKIIFNGQGQTKICHSSEVQLIHFMGEETEDNLWRQATWEVRVGARPNTNLLLNDMSVIV